MTSPRALRLRMAEAADASALLAIYEPYVAETAITFELESPGVPEFTRRVAATLERFPYLVCHDGDSILGYAYAGEHNERKAYQWNAELSVYVDRRCTGLRIGSALYDALISLLKLQNYRNIYGCVTVPNPASEALHKNFGFGPAGLFRNSGNKFGRWHDVAWFEKQINVYDSRPQPPVSLSDLGKDVVEDALARSALVLKPTVRA